MKAYGRICAILFGAALLAAGTPQAKGVWTDPNHPSLPPCFKVQGEYTGQVQGGGKLGCQVIGLGNRAFQAVLYPGGLPGAGWDGKNKMLMDGQLDGAKAVFKPAEGSKRYLGKTAKEFSATKAFPPPGHKPCTAEISGGVMSGKIDGKAAFKLEKTVRTSSTLGKTPPAGALVLFNGKNKDEFEGGRLDEKTKLLNTDGKDIRTKRKFSNYVMHLEFMLPYRPDARGQGRGNSGFYQVDHYEMQILDSFGLEGLDNECGGIYKKKKSDVNMCFPPLTWQTYDVEFTNAVADAGGNKTRNAVFTARLNGVIIHDKFEIDGKTGGSRRDPEGTPGPIKLQGHGNPLQFRNIWIVEKK